MIKQVAAVCLSLLFPITDTFAQAAHGQGPHEVQIEGTVQTPDGAVLPGASVHVFGTALTTTSDGDGRYTLNFTHAPARLIIVVDLDNYRSDDSVVEIDGPFMATVDFTLTPSFSSDVVVIAEMP